MLCGRLVSGACAISILLLFSGCAIKTPARENAVLASFESLSPDPGINLKHPEIALMTQRAAEMKEAALIKAFIGALCGDCHNFVFVERISAIGSYRVAHQITHDPPGPVKTWMDNNARICFMLIYEDCGNLSFITNAYRVESSLGAYVPMVDRAHCGAWRISRDGQRMDDRIGSSTQDALEAATKTEEMKDGFKVVAENDSDDSVTYTRLVAHYRGHVSTIIAINPDPNLDISPSFRQFEVVWEQVCMDVVRHTHQGKGG